MTRSGLPQHRSLEKLPPRTVAGALRVTDPRSAAKVSARVSGPGSSILEVGLICATGRLRLRRLEKPQLLWVISKIFAVG